MAAEGKAIIFYRCNLFIFYLISIDERPAMESQPNLASRSELVSMYKYPKKCLGPSPQIRGAKKIKFFYHFFRDFFTRHRISMETRRQTKMSIYNVSHKS